MPFKALAGLGWLHRIETRLIEEHGRVAASFEDDSVYVSAVLDIICAKIHLERIGKAA